MSAGAGTPLSLPGQVAGIVFDCDGLLLDTEECWTRAQATMFARHGRPFGPADKQRLIGRTVPAVCAILADEFGVPGEEAQLETELVALVNAELVDLAPMPGAIDLLDALTGRIPLAVATNSSREMLDQSLQRARIGHYFDASVAADEVAHPKPSPDVYLAAFARLGSSPQAGVAFEDSAAGAAAAHAAGTHVIGVPSLPDTKMTCDVRLESLADPRVLAWARSVRRQTLPGTAVDSR